MKWQSPSRWQYPSRSAWCLGGVGWNICRPPSESVWFLSRAVAEWSRCQGNGHCFSVMYTRTVLLDRLLDLITVGCCVQETIPVHCSQMAEFLSYENFYFYCIDNLVLPAALLVFRSSVGIWTSEATDIKSSYCISMPKLKECIFVLELHCVFHSYICLSANASSVPSLDYHLTLGSFVSPCLMIIC